MGKSKAGKDYIGVGGGALIINDQNKTLLLQRGKKASNDIGVWCKPGGAVEYGETVEAMIKREVREELGVEIEIIKWLKHTDHFVDDSHWVAFNCIATIRSGTPRNMEPEKHSEIKWFSLDKLPRNLATPTKDAIEEYLKK